MITKERLEQLIEQGATIWKVPYGTPIETTLHKYSYVCNKLNLKEDYLMEYSLDDCSYIMSGILSRLFETKEDAEEYAEFGNVTRTERLELPSWEEIKEKDDCFFNSKDYKICLSVNIEGNRIKIFQCVFGGGNFIIFDKPITRENYNEARRLCVKLFKGEENG